MNGNTAVSSTGDPKWDEFIFVTLLKSNLGKKTSHVDDHGGGGHVTTATPQSK